MSNRARTAAAAVLALAGFDCFDVLVPAGAAAELRPAHPRDMEKLRRLRPAQNRRSLAESRGFAAPAVAR